MRINKLCRYGDGCRSKSTCDFVHSSDPGYTALSNKRRDNGGYSGSDRRSSHAGPSRDRDGGWSGGASGSSSRRRSRNEDAPSSAEWNYGGVARGSSAASDDTKASSSGWDRPSSPKPRVETSEDASNISAADFWSSLSVTDDPKEDGGGWGVLAGKTTEKSSNGPGWGGASGTAASASETSGWGGASEMLTWGNTSKSNETAPTASRGWASSDPAKASSPTSTTGGWGGWSNTQTTASPKNTSTTSGWGGWSNTETIASAKNTSTTSGWGKSEPVAKESASAGWGAWGSNASPERGSGVGWGNDAGSKDKGKGKEQDRGPPENNQMQDPPRHTNNSSKMHRSDLPPLDLPHATNSSPAPLATPSSAMYAPPSSAGLPTPPTSSGFLKKAAMGFLDGPEGSLPTKIPKYRGPKDRVAVYEATIKRMLNATMLSIELRKLEDKYEAMRRTQTSAIYNHATPKTRQILADNRAQANLQLVDVRHAFHKEINVLISLPDMSQRRGLYATQKLTKEVIAEYTTELKDWFQELQLHKRLLAEEKEDENAGDGVQAVAGASGEGGLSISRDAGMTGNDIDQQDQRPKPSDILKRAAWTWKDLVDAADVLDQQLSEAQDNFYFDAYTNVGDDVAEEMKKLDSQLGEVQRKEEALRAAQHLSAISDATQSLVKTDKKLVAEVERLAALMEREAALQNELKTLKQESQYIDQVCEQTEKQCEEFEKWKISDMAQISEITEQLKTLHLLKRPPPAASSNPPPPPPIAVPDLLPLIRPLILSTLENDIKPVLAALQVRCIENQTQFQAELMAEADEISEQSEVVRKMVEGIGKGSLVASGRAQGHGSAMREVINTSQIPMPALQPSPGSMGPPPLPIQ